MNENDVLPGYVEKDYEELTITDNFLFGKIMRNPRLCKKLLEIILDIEDRENRISGNGEEY